MEAYLTYLFVLNIFIIFIDATIGYLAAPTLARLTAEDEEGAEITTRSIRSLLTFVVALYMFFNCFLFFNPKPSWLLLLTAVIVVDITAQLIVSGKAKRRNEQN